MADVIETDYSTNPPTITERDFTPEEIAQRKIDDAAVAEAEKARQEAEAKREQVLDKLAVLGLTRDDLTALGL